MSNQPDFSQGPRVASDRELAAIELADREAAFVRARAKLAAERAAVPNQQEPRPPWAEKLAPAIVWTVIVLIWTLFHVVSPERLDPTTWWSDLDRPLLFLGPLSFALAFAVSLLRERRSNASEKAPENVLLEFYAQANGENSKPPHNLARYVAEADLDAAPRRPPALKSLVALPPALKTPHELDVYWANFTRIDGKRRGQMYVCKAEALNLAPDLVLVRARVHMASGAFLSEWHSNLVLLAFIAASVLGLHLRLVPNSEILSAGLPVVAVMLGLRLWARSRWHQQVDAGHPIQKLMIRSGRQWKLFCADWEGWEEADLSWLDTVGATDGR